MKKLLIPILGLLLFLVACAPVEKGTINFISGSSTLHDDYGQTLVIINSSFESQKLASVSLDGSLIYDCVLMPMTDTGCPAIALPQPGTHTISASIQKQTGEVVSIQTAINWSPYTALDKLAQSIAGGEGKSILGGYALLTLIVVSIATIIFLTLGAVLTRGSAEGLGIGALLGFFFGMIATGIYVFGNATPGFGMLIVLMIGAIVIISLFVVIRVNAVNHGHSSTIVLGRSIRTDPNGTRTEAKVGQLYSGPSQHGPDSSRAFGRLSTRNQPLLDEE
jgi:hypothetical protein